MVYVNDNHGEWSLAAADKLVDRVLESPYGDILEPIKPDDGASFDTSENQEAAAKLQQWVKDGYFTPKFNGVGYDPAWAQFGKGAGPYLIGGTWLLADLSDALGSNLGFMLVPPAKAGDPPRALGGESLPFAITSKSKNPDVAAAYIDFLTDPNAAKVLVQTGNLPAMPTDAKPTEPAGVQVFDAWRALGEGDGLVPYLDYSTPDFYDQITASVQELMANRQSSELETESGLFEPNDEVADIDVTYLHAGLQFPFARSRNASTRSSSGTASSG